MPIPFPTELAADGRSVWVLSHGGSAAEQAVRVEALTNVAAEAFDVAGLALRGLAVAGGSAWVGDGPIYRLAPGASAVGAFAAEYVDFGLPDGVPNISSVPVAAEGSLWVSWSPPGPCCPHPADLYRVDPTTLKVIARIGKIGAVVASGDGFLWAEASTQGQSAPRLVRIDTETYTTKPIRPLGFSWADLTVADGYVWASIAQDDAIVRLDPFSGEEIERIRVPGEPGALTVLAGAVWAAITDNGTVVRYDTETDQIETIDVGGTPNDIVFANNSLWVAVLDNGPTDAQPLAQTPSGPVLLDLRTGDETPLPENIAGGHDYAASLDGRSLAYIATGDEGTPQVFTASIEGNGVRQVTHDPTGAASPAWSPDQTMIAYVGHENYFAVLDLASGESTGLTRGDFRSGLQFAPDGSSILFTGGSPERPVLRTVPVAGGKSTLLFRLSDGLHDSGNGSLSPDGSLLTYVGSGSSESGHCGPCHFVANADGTDRRVIPCHGSDPAGTWSPDGSRIVCSDGSVDGIMVVDIATGDVVVVAEGDSAIWIDRHTLLVERSSSTPSPSGGGTIEVAAIPRESRIVEGVRFSFRVPTKAWSNGPISPGPNGSGFRAGRLYISQSIMGPQGAEAVIFWTSFPDGARADPCDNLLSPTMGPSAAELATAVATAPGTKLVEGPSNVTVGRLPAKHVVLTVRRDLGCDAGFFYAFNGGTAGAMWPGTNVGDTIRVWIVDVDGTRLFIEAETTTQADAELEKEIQQIIGSIRFD